MIASAPYNKMGALPTQFAEEPGWLGETRGRKSSPRSEKAWPATLPHRLFTLVKVKEGPFKNYETKGLEITLCLNRQN